MIAFDAFSFIDGGGAGQGNPTILVHTGTGSDLVAFVTVKCQTGVTAQVTYDGVDMTKLADSGGFSMWYLIAPNTGTVNVVASGFADICKMSCATYSGVNQTHTPYLSTSNSGTSPLTTTEVPGVDNSWAVVGCTSLNSYVSSVNMTDLDHIQRSIHFYDSDGVVLSSGVSFSFTGAATIITFMAILVPVDFGKTLNETVIYSELINKGYPMRLSETITFTDIILRARQKILTDVVTFIDFISHLLPWRRRNRPTSIWTPRTPPETDWTDRTPPS